MLIYQKETRELVRRIVFRVTTNRALHEDLTQEGFIHLWLREKQRPGQTQSWYLQSCRFFLQNYMRNGRSLSSTRHLKALRSTVEPDECLEASADESVPSDSVLALVSAREIVSTLAKWLAPDEGKILSYLTEGFGVRETATRLSISHTSVIRTRRRIAALALTLGIEPPPKQNGGHYRRETGSLVGLRK